MDTLRFPAVGDALRSLPVRNVSEGVVGHSIVDAEPAQLPRQPVMPIEVNLQAAGQPCRHSHVAQAELFVHEIEVVMQAFAVIRHEVRFAGLFVVPWLVRRTGLHRREDAHQAGTFASLRDDLFHPVFLPEVPFTYELDLDARFRRHLFGILPNPVTVRLGEPRIIENPYLPFIQERCHPSGETNPGQRPENQHPVKATQYARNLCGVSLG